MRGSRLRLCAPNPRSGGCWSPRPFICPVRLGCSRKPDSTWSPIPLPIERLDRETGGNGTWTLEADSGFSRPRCTNGSASPYTGQPEGSIVCSRGPGLPEAWQCAARSVARHRQTQPRPTQVLKECAYRLDVLLQADAFDVFESLQSEFTLRRVRNKLLCAGEKRRCPSCCLSGDQIIIGGSLEEVMSMRSATPSADRPHPWRTERIRLQLDSSERS